MDGGVGREEGGMEEGGGGGGVDGGVGREEGGMDEGGREVCTGTCAKEGRRKRKGGNRHTVHTCT